MNVKLFPPEELPEAVVTLPWSKSVSNRQLIIAALTPSGNRLPEVADCEDTHVLVEALKSNQATHFLEGSGTALRFLTAYFAALPDCVVNLDGNDVLRKRPISQLVEALRSLGADISYTEIESYAPLLIKGRKLSGGNIEIESSISSQFISALMMIGPTMETPLTLTLRGETVSMPYILMTKKLMAQAGADIHRDGNVITIKPGNYRQTDFHAERDWSAASYWYEITALSAGFFTLPGLFRNSIQGDKRCADLFEMLGVMTSEAEDSDGLELAASPEQFSRFETDLSDNPDLAPTFAVTASMLGIPFHLTGLSTLAAKECNRLFALQNELQKFGILSEIRRDCEIVWNGERRPVFELPQIDTYGDHRMAMAFAPASLYVPGLVIKYAEVVNKSYPDFWNNLREAGFSLEETLD